MEKKRLIILITLTSTNFLNNFVYIDNLFSILIIYNYVVKKYIYQRRYSDCTEHVSRRVTITLNEGVLQGLLLRDKNF